MFDIRYWKYETILELRLDKMKKGFFALCIVAFGIIILNIAEIIHSGFFADIYPNISVDSLITNIFWVSLAITFVLFIIMLYLGVMKEKENRKTAILIMLILIVMDFAVNAYNSKSYYDIAHGKSLNEEKQDYIKSEWFRGISLDELKADADSDESVLVYIGSDDCKECLTFEEKFETELKKLKTEIPTYYTSSDIDGEQQKDMQEFLDKYNIEGVPTVVLFKKSKVLKMWDNPIEEIDEISSYHE